MIGILKQKNNQQGFTLIETFVAISILVVAVLGPMTLLSSALRDSRYIKDEIIATYLAQEGVELVIDDRNNDKLITGKSENYSCNVFYLSEEGYSCDPSSGSKTIFSREVSVDSSAVVLGAYRVVSIVRRSNLPNKDITSSSLIFKY